MIRWLLALPLRVIWSLLRFISAPRVVRATSAEDAAARVYIKHLEEHYDTSHVPILAQSYSTAVDKAKREFRLLLVVLTSEVHDETPALHKLLCDDVLKSFIQDHDVLVWAGNVAELEPYQVSCALGATRYPFLGVIVYNEARGSSMSCVSRIEGLPNVIDLMSHLTHAIDRYGPTLVSLKADRQEQNFARSIRAEQDSAYDVSLRKDREKVEARRRAEAEAQLQEQSIRKRLQNASAWRQWKNNTMSPEPEEATRVSRISFRMPDGSRCIRKFTAETTLEDIYAWVDVQLNPVIEVDSSIRTPPPQYEHSYDFTVAVPMPRKVIEATSRVVVRDTKEIYPSASLIVEKIE